MAIENSCLADQIQFSAVDISSKKELGTYTNNAANRQWVDPHVYLAGLNSGAATITLYFQLKDLASANVGPEWNVTLAKGSATKLLCAPRVAGWSAFGELAIPAGWGLTVSVQSSNGSDTSISGTLDFANARAASFDQVDGYDRSQVRMTLGSVTLQEADSDPTLIIGHGTTSAIRVDGGNSTYAIDITSLCGSSVRTGDNDTMRFGSFEVANQGYFTGGLVIGASDLLQSAIDISNAAGPTVKVTNWNSSSSGTAAAVYLTSAGSNVSAAGLRIENTGGGAAVFVKNNSASNPSMRVDNTGGGLTITLLDGVSITSGTSAPAIDVSNTSTGAGIKVTGNSTGPGIDFYNAAGPAIRALSQGGTTACVHIVQEGSVTAHALMIEKASNGEAVHVSTGDTSSAAIKFQSDGPNAVDFTITLPTAETMPAVGETVSFTDLLGVLYSVERHARVCSSSSTSISDFEGNAIASASISTTTNETIRGELT